VQIRKLFKQTIQRRAARKGRASNEVIIMPSMRIAIPICLDIPATAKGVETPEQFDALGAAGVDRVQGFLGRPAPGFTFDFDAAPGAANSCALTLAAMARKSAWLVKRQNRLEVQEIGARNLRSSASDRKPIVSGHVQLQRILR